MLDHFDLLAPIYDLVIPSPDPARLRDLLRLPTRGRVLEAGGGTGRVSEQLVPLVGTLVINDLSGPMLKQAQKKGALHPAQSHVERLPFPDATFSRVIAVDALHHFDDHHGAIHELLRVLKPGGRLVIEEPDISRFPVKLIALVEKLALMRSHFLSEEEIRALVASHGLDAQIGCIRDYATCVLVDK
ncbi:MAG: class I SAM-dependent methyltransferase [Anaerolineae bacterium]|jgi:demethylmenaquinone methyltransferase/2-methoxy-6-polyprenyl-1,4-benzoquinol methylase